MKKVIALFLFLFCQYQFSLAQTNLYHPFPDSNAVWREWRWGGDGGLYHYEWEEEKFIFGDTLIGGLIYQKIYESGYFTQYLISTYDTSYYYYNNLRGCVREDSNKKVWLWTGSEDLLYDFNLQLYDTLPESIFNNGGDTIIISSIDSIYDGTNYRKRLILSTSFYPNYNSIIEGIGSTYGLLALLAPPFESGGVLHCFIQNDSIRLTDGTLNACDIIGKIQSAQQRNLISISPNPFHSETTIRCRWPVSGTKCHLKIYNTVGMIVRNTLVNFDGDKAKIFRERLNDGIYFYELLSDNFGFIAKGKLIIQ